MPLPPVLGQPRCTRRPTPAPSPRHRPSHRQSHRQIHYRGALPSRAVHIHDAIYRQRPDISAILIAQPASALAFCITGAPFHSQGIPESYVVLGDVVHLPFESVTNPQQIAAGFSGTRSCVFIDNYGACVCGPSLLKAFDRLEVLETMSRVHLLAWQRGEPQLMNDEQVKELEHAFMS